MACASAAVNVVFGVDLRALAQRQCAHVTAPMALLSWLVHVLVLVLVSLVAVL
jgi:hypothetical protein